MQSSILECSEFMCKFVLHHLLFAISTLSNIEYLWCSSWPHPAEKRHLWTCKRGKFKRKSCLNPCLASHCEPEESSLQESSVHEMKPVQDQRAFKPLFYSLSLCPYKRNCSSHIFKGYNSKRQAMSVDVRVFIAEVGQYKMEMPSFSAISFGYLLLGKETQILRKKWTWWDSFILLCSSPLWLSMARWGPWPSSSPWTNR